MNFWRTDSKNFNSWIPFVELPLLSVRKNRKCQEQCSFASDVSNLFLCCPFLRFNFSAIILHIAFLCRIEQSLQPTVFCQPTCRRLMLDGDYLAFSVVYCFCVIQLLAVCYACQPSPLPTGFCRIHIPHNICSGFLGIFGCNCRNCLIIKLLWHFSHILITCKDLCVE